MLKVNQPARPWLRLSIFALLLLGCGAAYFGAFSDDSAASGALLAARPTGGETRASKDENFSILENKKFSALKNGVRAEKADGRKRLIETKQSRLLKDPQVVESLQKTAEEQGSVRVIVGVRADFTPEGALSRAAGDTQRARIQAAQENFLGKLAGFRVNNVKQFETIPYVALEADAAALELMKNDPDVTSIQEDAVREPTLAESSRHIGAYASWTAGLTGSAWTVAVLDTGVDKSHPFFGGRVVSEACYSTTTTGYASVCPGGVASSTASGSGVNCSTSVTGCDHGTHVAGIAAGNNASNDADGVARAANIIAVQVFSRRTSDNRALSFTSDYVKGLERVYALRSTYNIAAANMSLGGGGYTATCDSLEPSTKAAIDNLRSANIATIIAAGNDGYTNALGAPACISSAISVGSTRDGGSDVSTGSIDTVSDFSNSASFLSILAPGELITSSIPGTGYDAKQGTSMAAPQVAGAWAVAKHSMGSSATVQQVLDRLNNTGVSVTDSANGITKKRIRVDTAIYAGCSPSISPGSTTASGAGGSGSFTVTLSSGCGWTALSNASWITTSSSTTGSGTVAYTVAANNTGASRTGTIYVAGQTFTVTQPINCTPTLTPTAASFGGNGGSGSFTVSYPAACGSANVTNNNNTWIGGSISGNTVNYTVLANNTGATRTGSFSVTGSGGTATHTITQGSCASSVSPTSYSVNDYGGTNNFAVSGVAGCSWTATSNQSWATVTSGASGAGSGTVVYSIAANTTASARTATISVSTGGTHTITQDAAPTCTYSLGSTSRTVDADADNFTFTISPNRSFCSWSASVTSGGSWLSITSGASGTGSGTIHWAVAANTSTASRTGTIVAGGQTYTVTQTGATGGATCSTAPNNLVAWYRGENNANDAAGTNNGTAQNGATYAAGLVGQSFSLDGTDDFVSVPNGASVDPTSDLTIEGWIFAPSTGVGRIASKTSVAGDRVNYVLGLSAGKLIFFSGNAATGSLNSTLQSTMNVPLNQWSHVAISVSATTVTFVVNGTAESASINVANRQTTDGPLFVGATVNNGTPTTGVGHFAGRIDELSIYNRALSTAEIQAIYNANSAGKCVPQCSYAISPTSASIAAAGASNQTFTITTGANCSWTATSDAAWLTTGSTGTGNGTITFNVAANTSTASRTGTISVGGQTFTVTQAGAQANCTYTLSPTSYFPGGGGGSTSFALTTQSGCTWTATSLDAWATITSGASGTGNGTINVTVAANGGAFRETAININGAVVAGIYQAGCSATIDPANASVGAGGILTYVQVTINSGCSWTATSNASWITFDYGSSGTGSGQIVLTTAQNTSPNARTGTATIAGQTFTVTQAGAQNCTYSLSPTSRNVSSGATATTTSVTAPAGCAWTATSNDAWITVIEGSGTGNGSAQFGVAANTSTSPRTGTATVAGQTFTITQEGAPNCAYTLAPTNASVAAAGGAGSIALTAASGCAWTATANNSWITVTSGANGSGNGTIGYSVAANTGAARTGTITAGGQTFTVSQAAAGSNCVVVSMPTNLNAAPGATIEVPVNIGTVGEEVEAFDFAVQYDPAILTPATVSNSTVGTLSENRLTVLSNAPTPGGKLIVSGSFQSASIPANSQGTLVKLLFTVNAAANGGATSNLTFVSPQSGAQPFTFNGGSPCASPTGGLVTVANGAIAGAVNYAGAATRMVRGVSLAAAGSVNVAATTLSDGLYRLAGLGSGAYTVTPTKTGDVAGVSSLDASRAQQYLVGLRTLTPAQLVAADTTGEGNVTSLDVSRIRQYLVGVNSTHIIGRWKFTPATKNYSSVAGEVTGENYEAILVGDVSGDWTAPAPRIADEESSGAETKPADTSLERQPDVDDLATTENDQAAGESTEPSGDQSTASRQAAPQADVTVRLPANARALNGTVIEVPVTVTTLTEEIEAFDFAVQYDPAVLTPASQSNSTTGTLSENRLTVLSNAPQNPGNRLIVSGSFQSASIPAGASGVLVKLRFTVTAPTGAQSPLAFTTPPNGTAPFVFNGGTPTVTTVNGQFTSGNAPTAATATVSGRVTTANGRGIRNALVTLTEANGTTRTVLSGANGRYSFADVAVGQNVIVGIRAKRFWFAPNAHVVSVAADTEVADFAAQ